MKKWIKEYWISIIGTIFILVTIAYLGGKVGYNIGYDKGWDDGFDICDDKMNKIDSLSIRVKSQIKTLDSLIKVRRSQNES